MLSYRTRPSSIPRAKRCIAGAGKVETAWSVYNGRMPLVGMEQLSKALSGTPVHQFLQLHTYTLLAGPDEMYYFDFLPLRPTAPVTALLLLTASNAPGEVRVRRLDVGSVRSANLGRLMLRGPCELADPVGAAHEYNSQFDTNLHLLHNNCTHHTRGLTKLLLQGPGE